MTTGLGRPYTREEIIGLIELERNTQVRYADAAKDTGEYEASRCHQAAEAALNSVLEKARSKG
jgi:hypothetical protein